MELRNCFEKKKLYFKYSAKYWLGMHNVILMGEIFLVKKNVELPEAYFAK